MKKSIIIFLFLQLLMLSCPAQTLTIEQCYELAENNYPAIKQRELIARASAYTIDNIRKGYWPQITINGQASHQSEVTTLPFNIPGIETLQISKDQYKLFADINQVIYDGGVLKKRQNIEINNESVEQHKVETELYALREQVNQLFFGILLVDQQIGQNNILQEDIESGLSKIQGLITNGTALKSSGDALKAEHLKAKQQAIELYAGRKAFCEMLTLFTGYTITNNTTLIKPPATAGETGINRPELKLYNHQKEGLTLQQQLLTAKAMPKLSFYFQGGAGRPALNMLSNNFEGYYTGGLRLTWSLSALYTIKKEKALLDNSRNILAAKEETFLFNTRLIATRQYTLMEQYRELLQSDEEIIALRETIKQSALAQLENGVITSNDYLKEVYAEDQAKQAKMLHEIKMLAAQYDIKTTTGTDQTIRQ